MGRAVPDDHDVLGRTREAAAAARLISWEMCDLELPNRRMAPHKYFLAREKPTNVDDEGCSEVSSANGRTPGVEKESRAEEERMCYTFCLIKQTEYGEREDGSA